MLSQVMRYAVAGLRYGLALGLGLATLLTLVSVVPSAAWWVQALGFPRLQTLLGLAAAGTGLALLGWPAHRRWRAGLLLGGGLALAGQAWFLAPYLPFAPRPVPDAPAASPAHPAARLRVLRWPLDHFFVSRPFQVAALRRLPAVGSDHFPLYAELVLPPPVAPPAARPRLAPGGQLP